MVLLYLCIDLLTRQRSQKALTEGLKSRERNLLDSTESAANKSGTQRSVDTSK